MLNTAPDAYLAAASAAPATGLAGQNYINSSTQGLSQFIGGPEKTAPYSNAEANAIDPIDFSTGPPSLRPPQSSTFQKNGSFNYNGFRGRAFSDVSPIQSANLPHPNDYYSPLATSTLGHQVSPILSDAAATRQSPTQPNVGLNGFNGSNLGAFPQSLAYSGDAQDRHFTHRPEYVGSIFNYQFPTPSSNTNQLRNVQQPMGQNTFPTHDEQLLYWGGVNKSGWNQAIPSETHPSSSYKAGFDQAEALQAYRRYSCGEPYIAPMAGQLRQMQSTKQFNSQSTTKPKFSVTSLEQKNNQNYEDKNLEIVLDYFTVDVHQRVKVSVDFFDQRFMEEKAYLEDLYQLPQFPLDSSARNLQLVLVCFKAGRLDVFYLPEGKHNLKSIHEGDLVIVEADRGRDLGKVVRMNISVDQARLLKLLQFLEQLVALNEKGTEDITMRSLLQSSNSGTKDSGVYFAPPTLYCPKPIISLALRTEVTLLISKSQDEEKACKLSLAKISSTLSLLNAGETKGTLTLADLSQMRLIDAEYQFDRRKLIFYYSTHKRIDFRDLVRELFRIYKTRIWMCAVTGIPYQSTMKKSTSRQQSKLDTSESRRTSERSSMGLISTLNSELSNPLIFDVNATSELVYDEIPRKYHGARPGLEEENRGSGESLVLKSLVDTLNN